MIFFDTEILNNYHLLLFKDGNKFIEATSIDHAKEIIDGRIVITFNGNSFDIPLLRYYFNGATTEEIKIAANDIINGKLTPYRFYDKYSCNSDIQINTIDLIEICPGQGSLKLYGARFHSQNLQDLPFDPYAVLTEQQKKETKEYCKTDLNVTEMLYNKLKNQIDLRRVMSKQFNIDLRSKSDAQIAETVIKTKIGNISKHQPTADSFEYIVPDYIQFSSMKLNMFLEELRQSTFIVDKKGSIIPPVVLKEPISVGGNNYQLGMGGIHSQEQNCHHVIDQEHLLADFDVSSYYPSIILNLGLYPKRIGPKFLEVYKDLVDERLDAKRNGDKSKADSLKITINGSFGKFGSIYSNLYAPDLLIQVTVTGQLALLMLIEKLEIAGIEVVSANTDGIVCKCRYDMEEQMLNIIKWWEDVTRFEMERTDYSGLYSRDVNNYIAIKLNNDVKTKGCYGDASWQKNPQNDICNEAIIQYILHDVSFEKTIRDCKQIEKFLNVRTVKGGAVKNGNYIGKVVRWYYRKGDFEPIVYKDSGNMVATSTGGQPLMRIEGFPDDVNYDFYIAEAKKMYDAFFGKAIIEKSVRVPKSVEAKIKKLKPQMSLF